MTLAEVERFLQSFKRREDRRLKEKASFDYKLAGLVGVSFGRYFSKNFDFPEIYEAYPSIFSKEEVEEARIKDRQEKSIQNLMNFVKKYNEQK